MVMPGAWPERPRADGRAGRGFSASPAGRGRLSLSRVALLAFAVSRLCSHGAPAVGDAIRLHPASASSPCLYFRSTICSLLPQPCSRHVFESGTGHVARVGLVLAVILPHPFECWGYPRFKERI